MTALSTWKRVLAYCKPVPRDGNVQSSSTGLGNTALTAALASAALVSCRLPSSDGSPRLEEEPGGQVSPEGSRALSLGTRPLMLRNGLKKHLSEAHISGLCCV